MSIQGKRRVLIMGLLVAVAAIGGAAAFALGWGRVAQSQGGAGPNFTYTAKFICGTASAADPLEPGQYATAINVHNFQDNTVPILKKVVLAPAEPMARVSVLGGRGFPSGFRELDVPADAAFEIDCPDILSLLRPPIPTFVRGFVVVESSQELAVWGVYTSTQTAVAPSAGVGVTEDVEVVPSKGVPFCDFGSGAADPDADNLTTVNEYLHGTHPCINDSDLDGCADGEELGPNKRLGGQRDPTNYYDLYDITNVTGVVGAKDKAVAAADLNMLLSYGGTRAGGPPNIAGKSYDADTNGNGIPDGREIDFAGAAGPHTGPDGGIGPADLNDMLQQGFDSCVAPP